MIQQPDASPQDVGDYIEAVLRRHAAPRQRVADEHNFVGDDDAMVPGTFRLQLFTAPGHRAVAVATQTSEEGASLDNRAERYAATAWQTHCAGDDQPPIWIQLQLPGSDFQMVNFKVNGTFQLSSPRWHLLTAKQLETLVGAVVDPHRGADYTPRLDPPEDELRYEFVAVADLPPARPFREVCMAPNGSWWWRLWAWVRRTARGRHGCCWYHTQNWHTASQYAILIVDQARRDGLADCDLPDQMEHRARAAKAPHTCFPALRTLLTPSIAIDASLGPDGAYTNGQHRARAMHDAGVERTVIVSWVPAE